MLPSGDASSLACCRLQARNEPTPPPSRASWIQSPSKPTTGPKTQGYTPAAATAPQVLAAGPAPAAPHASGSQGGQSNEGSRVHNPSGSSSQQHAEAGVTGGAAAGAGASKSASPTAGMSGVGVGKEEKVVSLLTTTAAAGRGGSGAELLLVDQGGAPTVSSSASDASLASLQHHGHEDEEMEGAGSDVVAVLCRRLASLEQEVAALRRREQRGPGRRRPRHGEEGGSYRSGSEEEDEDGPEPPTLGDVSVSGRSGGSGSGSLNLSSSSFHLRIPRRKGKGSRHPGWPLLRSMDTIDLGPEEEEDRDEDGSAVLSRGGSGGYGPGLGEEEGVEGDEQAGAVAPETAQEQEQNPPAAAATAATPGLMGEGLRQRRRPLPTTGPEGDRANKGGAAIVESLSAASLGCGDGAVKKLELGSIPAPAVEGGAAVVSSPVAAAMAAAAAAAAAAQAAHEAKQRHRREEGEERAEGLPVVAAAEAAVRPPPAQGGSLASLGRYVWREAFGGSAPPTPADQAAGEEGGEDGGEKADAVVRNFLSVPARLEACLAFGLAVCVDAFLGALTVLPLRVLRAVGHLFLSPILAFVLGIGRGKASTAALRGAHLHELLRGLTLVAAAVVLQSFQISRVYHYIRGQATIKLYVLTAMFEILDKLLVSFGQDALDALYHASVAAAATQRGGSSSSSGRRRRLLASFLVACGYVISHAVLLFVHVVTLFVAVNSADQALLTLLISNNFAEMKTSVFKRFDAKLLFQLTCSDMVERFKLLLFLGLITALNVAQQAGRDPEAVSQVLRDMGQVSCLIFLGEIVADAVKHAFITKFNEIDAACYDRAREELSREVLTAHRAGSAHSQQLVMVKGKSEKEKERPVARGLDHARVVCKKIGLAQLPLAAVAVRFSAIAWAACEAAATDNSPWPSLLAFAAFTALLFLVLLLTKLASGILLTHWAARVERSERRRRELRARLLECKERGAAAVAAAGGGGAAVH